ncbi:MAG TPA: BON domain-containing protein [Terriglobales bacterium]|nr:BON domain-containing protein [Terriglobales bacterium]
MKKTMLLALLAAVMATTAAAQNMNRDQLSSRALERVTTEVRHQLLLLPYYGVFDFLSYKVDPSGVVTLMGEVTRPTLKSDAENVVKRIEGVERVDNQIKVLPLSPNDDRIRREAFRAIYGAPQLTKYSWQAVQSIHILVDNGQITLVGQVDNQADKDVAGIRAKGVSGAFSVTNNLQVAGS